ncbi:unnamed protein product [Callosobruchus maculatus]|uniref:Uncharacterized protein n=1 Tax=Callosobruchus maculatus TaxID=64391 RepID=A0A653BMW1_CALMS|nr:unnamed protein product [Callosobruchus maculatus]
MTCAGEPEYYEIVTDEHVITLIEAVSMHPEIYNPTHHNNESSAWEEVANDLLMVNCRISGFFCKSAWRDIRYAYLAYYKRKVRGIPAKYKYADHLGWLDRWLDPYLGLDRRNISDPGASVSSTNRVTEDKTFEEEAHVGDSAFHCNDTSPNNNIVEQNGEGQVDKALKNEDVEVEAVDVDLTRISQSLPEHTASLTSEEDTDMLFLKSILPDLHTMSGQQKNAFKLKTMQLIRDILYPTP